ncbi:MULTISPECIES: glycoside hydrolase family 2 protein [Streptomyces]|uniref:beta-mannosidase n=1 Tax=Streptomyces evansiae TaxID=3075535 RepID=A0ABU2RAA9_9ACTN|nr:MULTISPECIES: glycoside hydrolase family 2 protein [unclassified Streptomyces]EFL03991.1 beta-mannosidase [Streptomyces sp. SPB78]MDT0412200.1 glycoside hydrolase family 2 protein [Streptomyces sp. DSM 41979]MYQ56160.1 glycoside hydrolase family 2 protein [Streptomyces sp. SID4926]
MKASTPLDHGWTLRLDPRGHRPEQAADALVDEGVPARVPGCAHTDLLAAGLIPDPYLGRNEEEVAWVGRADWTYRTTLTGGSGGGHERADLVFDGLDTVAEVRIGGRVLGRTRNMHRAYRFDATQALAAGGDVPLEVAFTSAYEEAEAVRARLGPRPNAYPEPFNFVRKMASSFGWDWGPTLVTAGIWRQARLERWSLARLAEVRPEVTVAEDGTGRVRVRIAVERTAGGAARTLRASVRVAGVEATARLQPGSDAATICVEVPDVALWWPRGYGEQPLYDCEVTLGTDDTEEVALDSWERRVGFRTVVLDTAEDAEGSAFTLRVNGQPVFARGVNWIPDDTLVSRVDAARYRRRLAQAAKAGVNLVRVWGGGIYESEDFYDACDEAGLLVWQDFLFACAAYPEEEPLRTEVEAEARENVVRLMPHPSLVLWNGNNENLWGFRDWGWAEELNGASWGEGYYLDLLPRVVAEADPTRPYWAGSPWSGSPERHPNNPRHGTTHSWEVWNRLDYAAYREDVPRFMAEFGWQAPPAYATLRRALGEDQLAPDSPDMLHHQKAADGNGKLARGLAPHFGAPVGFDAWHYLTQLNQARAVATGIEHWRAHWPVCAGTVLWQLNDCWPVTSWAAIDGAEREKPLYHELRRLYADRLLSLTVRDGRLALAVVNDAPTPWEGRARVRRLDAKGGEAAAYEPEFTVAARAVGLVELPAALTELGDPAREFLVAEADGLRALHFAVADKEFVSPAGEVRTEVVETAEGADVTVTAHTLVRDLLLQADRLAPTAKADRGLVTLLPGESVTYRVSGWDGTGAVDAALWWVDKARSAAG